MDEHNSVTLMTVTEVVMSGFNSTYNDTDDTDFEPGDPFRHPLYMRVIYSVAYITIMIMAVVGNVMVVAVVYRNQSMHSVTNYFIVNLAIADIMVAVICLPMTLLFNLYKEWHFGWFMCKATPYLQGVSVCASVNTLAAIAVDRYLAICLPLDFKISKRGCKITIISIWIAAFAVLIPWAVFYKLSLWQPPTGNPMILCFEDWPHDGDQKHYFLGAIFLCCYSVPLVLIVACYFLIGLRVWRRRVPGVKNPSLEIVHKSKVNAVKMLAVVVVLFAFSWLPLYALRLKAMFGKPSSKELQTILQDIINPIAQWLGSSNSGMNPVIYFFFSKRYRRGFKETIHCCDSGKKRLQNRSSLFHQMSTQSYANGASGKPRLTYIFKTSPEKSNSTSTTQV